MSSQPCKAMPSPREIPVRGLLWGLLTAVALLLGAGPDALYAQDGDDEPEDLGREVYEETCVRCHQAGGRGIEGMFPSLRESELVQGPPEALLVIVLEGRAAMPGFGENLSDKQIAAVLTYLRTRWGNDAGRIHRKESAHMREHIATAGGRDEIEGR